MCRQFEYYLREQARLHPSMRPQDAAKLCYQAARGAEHLLADTEAARRYLYAEFEAVEPRDGELYEPISDLICRVDLAVLKHRGLSVNELFCAFVASCRISEDSDMKLAEYLDTVGQCIDALPFTANEWFDFLTEYKKLGMPAIHHSESYRIAEKPAYRIVLRDIYVPKGLC